MPTDVWSVTSYKELYHDATNTERHNLLNPGVKPKLSYLEKTMAKEKGVCIAASDYLKALPSSICRWLPGPLITLGTDGFGRSESRTALRDFFEVDARYIVLGALMAMAREGEIKPATIKKAIKDLDIDPGKLNPLFD